jgi:IQ calmodulin-binding motif
MIHSVVVRLHDALLALLADVLINQSIARRWSAKHWCVFLRNSHALMMQTAVRAMQARKRLKRIRAAITIQTAWRGFICYADYMFVISGVVLTQSVARQWRHRKE